MERRIVTVAEGPHGWDIDAQDHQRITVADVALALSVACGIAKAEHRTHGQPTAVKVSMHGGDAVMMGHCG